MPKLIDYPRTSYTGAWELAEIVDDTGGKSAIETAARKLNRKVSGSFKAIIGSAVKFGLMTSKRDLLTTTTLFKRIKHAYDKAEELQFHREAFLSPPLFTQLCRKFRNRELPVQMLDVMLIREFGVEEINAQSVSKAFVDGCRMCGLIDEQNIIADIDALHANRAPRRELSSAPPHIQQYSSSGRNETHPAAQAPLNSEKASKNSTNRPIEDITLHNSELTNLGLFTRTAGIDSPGTTVTSRPDQRDAIANLFGLEEEPSSTEYVAKDAQPLASERDEHMGTAANELTSASHHISSSKVQTSGPYERPQTMLIINSKTYQMQMSGPGVNTLLDISEEDDIAIAIALLEKIRRQLRQHS